MPKPKATKQSRFIKRLNLISVGSLSLVGIACQRKKKKTTSFRMPKGVHYQVKKGDTLYNIARNCGFSVKTLMNANQLYVTELDVGQILFLPYLKTIPYELTQSKRFVQTPNSTYYETEPQQQPTKQRSLSNRTRPKIVSRYEWGALPSKPNSSPMGKVKKITLHHTSEYPGMGYRSDRDVVRSIARYHRDTLGWADIGYHYVIGRDGKVYEGRPAKLQGAHVGGHNENNLGISMAGNFVSKLPSETQLSTLKSLLSIKFKEHGLSTHQLFGHRDFKATECPGEALYQWLLLYKLNS